MRSGGRTPQHLPLSHRNILDFTRRRGEFHLAVAQINHDPVHGVLVQGARMMRLFGGNQNPDSRRVDFHSSGTCAWSPETSSTAAHPPASAGLEIFLINFAP